MEENKYIFDYEIIGFSLGKHNKVDNKSLDLKLNLLDYKDLITRLTRADASALQERHFILVIVNR